MTLERLPEQIVLPLAPLASAVELNGKDAAAPLGIINTEPTNAIKRFLGHFKLGVGSPVAGEAESVPESQGSQLLRLPPRSNASDQRPLLKLPPRPASSPSELLKLPPRKGRDQDKLLTLPPRTSGPKAQLLSLSKTPDNKEPAEVEPVAPSPKKPLIRPVVTRTIVSRPKVAPVNHPEAVVKTTLARAPASVIVPVKAEKAAKLSAERKHRLEKAILLGAVAVRAVTAYGSQKIREIKRPSLIKGARATAYQPLHRAPKTNLRDKPLEILTHAKIRAADFGEKGREHKGLIIAAVGAVATIGVAYLAYKGIHHGDMSVVSQDAAPAPGSSGVDHHSAYQLVPKGHHLAPEANTLSVVPPRAGHNAVVDQLTSKTNTPSTLNHGDTIMVRQGDGLTNVIDTFAKQHHQKLSGAESYGFYQQLHAHFGNNILSSGTFNMPDGNIGISRPGVTTWNPDAQAFLEDLLKAAKKKKELI